MARVESTESSWCLADNGVQRLVAGAVVPVGAQEVLDAAFDLDVSGTRPQAVLTEIDFERIPHRVGLALHMASNAAVASIVAIAGTRWTPVDPHSDAAIVGRLWAPIRPGDIADVREFAAGLGIHLDYPLTLADVLRVRMARADFEIIDDADVSPERVSEALVQVPPAGLAVSLFPYQSRGLAFLRVVASQRVGCILGDEMGLGKTMQVLALLLDQKHSSVNSSLVVCPKSLIVNWQREAHRFAPSLSLLLHVGSLRAARPPQLTAFDVVVTTYDTLVMDQPLFEAIEWGVVAVDEAQYIKNAVSQRSIAVRRLHRDVSIAVTGTPLETHIDNVWTLLDFAVPGLFGDLKSFQRRFEDSADGARSIAPLLDPLLLRRRVSDVQKDLPDRIEIPQFVPAGSDLADAYDRVMDELAAGSISPLEAYRRTRMLTCHAGDVPLRGSEKASRLIDIVDEIFLSDQKLLIFSPYIASINAITDLMRQRYPHAYVGVIDGRVANAEDRLRIVDEFSATDRPGVLVLNPNAAGVGLNITAANHVVHFCPEWNPATTAQASARAHRTGQRLVVTVHHLAYAGSIEDRILERAQSRREMAQEAIEGSGDEPTAAELASLFETLMPSKAKGK